MFAYLQLYKKTSLKNSKNHKLAPNFYGPYQVRKRVGQVAYALDIKIHDVFVGPWDRKGRIHVEFCLSMEEENKGEEKGATTEEATSKEREGCCDVRRKVKKKRKRRHGTRKLHQISKPWQKDRARYEMTW